MARQRKARQGKATQGREVETIEWEDRVPKKFADEIKKSSPEDKNALIDRVIKIHDEPGANFCEGKLAIPIVDIYNFTCADKSEVTLQCTSTRYVIWKKADGKVDFAAICEIVMVDQDGTKNVLKEDQILSLTTFTLRTLHSLGVNAYNKCCVQLPAITTIDSIPVKFKFNHELFISKDLGKFNSRWLIRIVVPAVVAAANMELGKEISAAKRKQTRKVKAVNKIRENNGDRSAPSNEENNGSMPTVAPPLRSAAPPPPGAGGGLDGGGAGATGSGGGGPGGRKPPPPGSGPGGGLDDASALATVTPPSSTASNAFALAMSNNKSIVSNNQMLLGQQRHLNVIDDHLVVIDDHLVRNDKILLDHAGQHILGNARTDVLEEQVAGLGRESKDQNRRMNIGVKAVTTNLNSVHEKVNENNDTIQSIKGVMKSGFRKIRKSLGQNGLNFSSSSLDSFLRDSTFGSNGSVTSTVIDIGEKQAADLKMKPAAVVTESITPQSVTDSVLTSGFFSNSSSPVSKSFVGGGNAENNGTMCAEFSNLDVAHALEGPANPDPALTAVIASSSTTVVPPSDASLTEDMMTNALMDEFDGEDVEEEATTLVPSSTTVVSPSDALFDDGRLIQEGTFRDSVPKTNIRVDIGNRLGETPSTPRGDQVSSQLRNAYDDDPSTTVVPSSTARVRPLRALPTAGRKSVSFFDDDDDIDSESSGELVI